jgi:glycosyltransferase involved in cell wall biosynthesis
VTVLLPVFNDWESLGDLLGQIDDAAAGTGLATDFLIIDDGSTEECPSDVARGVRALGAVHVVRLRRNVGHQRAIAIGLALLAERDTRGTIAIMDADGEDRPRDVLVLLDRLRGDPAVKVVFAERLRRTEGLVFRALYRAYRVAHLVLTGVRVRVGNFSALSADAAAALVTMPELWNHYAAAVFRSRLRYESVPVPRGARLHGRSKMQFVSLVVHGLSAMSVFGETIGVRLMAGALALTAASAVALVASLAFLPSPPAIAALWILVLLLLSFQALVASVFFVFGILASRSMTGFLPIRDYRFFVLRERVVREAP